MFTCKICQQEKLTPPAAIPGSGPVCHRCADRMAKYAPFLLAACEQAADVLGRLWGPNAPTVAEVAALTGRLEAVATVARGGAKPAAWDVTEEEAEYWPDTSHR